MRSVNRNTINVRTLENIYLAFKFMRPEEIIKLVSIEIEKRRGPRDV